MKIFVSILGLAIAQQQPGQQTFQQFTTTPAPTTTPLPPSVPLTDRCKKNSNEKVDFYNSRPSQSTGTMCPQYECASCCNDDKANAFFSQIMTPEGNLKQHGIYNFEGCSGSKQATDKTGHISGKCQEYLTSNFCMSSCSPNAYIYQKSGPANRQKDMRVCGSYCDEFYAACKDEHICYNQDGLLEFITDSFFTELDSNKDYQLFSCTGSYECKKISETRVAQSKATDNLAELVSAKCATNPDLDICKVDLTEVKKPEELFCARFTFGMFQYATDQQVPCIDPRDDQTVIAQVEAFEAAANQDGDKVKFDTIAPCSTGLSAGAIAGIVIGVLAGIGLIAGLVWYFACRGSGGDADDDYTQGKQTDTEQAGGHQMSQKEPARDQSIVRSEADYDPSRTASAK